MPTATPEEATVAKTDDSAKSKDTKAVHAPAPKPNHKNQHGEKARPATQQNDVAAAGSKHKGKREKKQCRWLGIMLVVLSVMVLLLVFGVPRAAKDERVRAAVSDSVQRLNTTLVEQFDVRLDGFLEKLANFSDTVSSIIGDDGPRPGQTGSKMGLKAHHPVVIIPGFVTSGLELWQGEGCAASYFRQRLWGTLSMAQTLLADRACWMRHMKLDPITGSDPPGIKLRAAKALEAVDYFVPGYWVFSKMVQSLADLGYDNNNLVAVPYDWRLPMPVMQSRDGYFTRVKYEVELQLQLSQGIKPVLVSHSYGALVTLAFLSWVEQVQPGWVDSHLHGYVNLAGPVLGLPKALSPLLSGETRETVDMMAGLAVLVEQYLGKQSRAAMFRTWGSVLAMLPVGGPKVWGNASYAPDDDSRITAAGRSYGGMVALVRSTDANLRDAVRKNDSSLISNDSLKLLTTTLTSWGNMVKNLGSAASTVEEDGETEQEQQADAVINKSTGDGGGDEESEGDADSAGGGTQQVRFLDVQSALLSLAMTAGEQLSTNLQRWSAGGKQVNLSHVLAHHRKTAAQLTAVRQGSCQVDPEQPGDYLGKCENSESGAGAAGGASSSSKGRCSSERSAGVNGGGDSSGENGVDGSDTRDTEGSNSNGEVHGPPQPQPVNPVTNPLPNAPDFKLYCFYGVGTPTERGYHYLKTRRNGVVEWSVNNMVNDPQSGLESGVQLSPDGDGTVPLLSLGAMCAGGWKTRRLNPAGSEVVVREYPHSPGPVLKDARGGPGASTHVEILGNEPMLMDLLKIVAGQGEGMEEQYHSNIQTIASRIPWDEL